jgi:polyphosphate kinase
VQLLIRGICCLRPGVPGVSETIQVRAIVDRFLEHGRVFSFENGGKREIYISSADWMPRNFHRRVEVMVPIEDDSIKTRIGEILDVQLSDTAKAWRLRSDGSYERVEAAPGAVPIRSQQKFIEMARDKVKISENAARTSGRFHLQRAVPPRNGKPERKPRPPVKKPPQQ